MNAGADAGGEWQVDRIVGCPRPGDGERSVIGRRREAEKGVLRRDEVAYQPPLMRSLDIVGELLAGVRHEATDLNAKLAQLYAFVYARLTTAYVNADKQAMAEALQVLEIERETWRQAVEKLTSEQPAKPGVQARKKPAPKPHLGSAPSEAPTTGLSLEA